MATRNRIEFKIMAEDREIFTKAAKDKNKSLSDWVYGNCMLALSVAKILHGAPEPTTVRTKSKYVRPSRAKSAIAARANM